jgi:positive regulator of sigma E activity
VLIHAATKNNAVATRGYDMKLLKKTIFFYLCILLLLMLNTFIGKYISGEFQSVMYLLLIAIISLSIFYLIVKRLKNSDGKKRDTKRDTKKEEVFDAIAKEILEKKN